MAEYEIIRPRRETWLDRLKRSINLGPWNPRDPAISRYFGGGPVASGVSVNEQSAMNYSAVWGAVTLISGSISILPLEFYRREKDGNSKTKFRTHPLYRLLHDRANPQMGSSLFRRTMQANKLVWGNSYAEIERDAIGRPVAMWPLLPYQMAPYLDGGMLRYRYDQPNRKAIEFDAKDIVHLRGPCEDGICGVSAIRAGRESIGIGIAAERFAGRMYSNGLNVGGIITYPPGVGASNEKVREENRQSLERRHTGVDNAHRFLALYEGAKFEKTNIQPDDAQFLESRIFQVEEICRWFNIPPHKLKDLENATYSNIEQQNLEYLTDSLEPHLNEWEEELTLKLISPLEQTQQLIEFTREGFLRADATGRAALQASQLHFAMLTPNEGRALENRNPVIEGDTAFVPLTHIPLDMARDYWSARIEATKAPKEAPQPFPGNQPSPNDGETKALKLEIELLREQLVLSRSLTQKAEDMRDLHAAALDVEKQQHAETSKRAAEAQGRNVELASHLADAQRVIERADSAYSALQVRLDRTLDDFAQTALALRDTESALIGMTFERDDKIGAATKLAQLATQREQERDAALVNADTLTTERDTALADIEKAAMIRAGLEQELRDTVDMLAATRRDHDATIALVCTVETREQAVIAERDGLKTCCDIIEADYQRVCGELQEQRDLLQRTITENQTAADVALQASVALQGERDSARTALGETKNDLDVAKLRISTLEGDIARLESGVSAQRDQLTELAQREKDAKAHGEALSADVELLKTDLARARSDIAAELDKQKTQKATVLAAMRSLFVDATERLLQKEADRARKQQATPAKLLAHIGNFYPLHADVVRAAYQPIVGPWTAITGGAPNILLDRLVAEHLNMSEQALRLAADTEDADELAANLARTLNRWEQERAESMADALVREGMAL